MPRDCQEPVKIKVCVGSRCVELKARKIARRLRSCIEESDLADKVRVKTCDCMSRCKKGPLVTVPARGQVFSEAKPKQAQQILDEVLKGICN